MEIISYFSITDLSTHSFCIMIDSQFSGFCLLQKFGAKEGYKFSYEITLYLKKEITGNGIGKQAVLFLEQIAKKEGIKIIVAGISSENIESIKLFENQNYIKCGHMKNMVYKFNKFYDNIYYQKLL